MNLKTYQKAFTLVELVIVIAVIGILASITIVSYNQIRDQAQAEKTKTNAMTVQKVAESFYSRNNVYPSTVADFSNTQTTMPSDIQLITSGTLTNTNGEKSILYRRVLAARGACVYYWDYAPTDGSPAGIRLLARLGTATAGNCNETTGILPT